VGCGFPNVSALSSSAILSLIVCWGGLGWFCKHDIEKERPVNHRYGAFEQKFGASLGETHQFAQFKETRLRASGF
jgi:hypothetical protein